MSEPFHCIACVVYLFYIQHVLHDGEGHFLAKSNSDSSECRLCCFIVLTAQLHVYLDIRVNLKVW